MFWKTFKQYRKLEFFCLCHPDSFYLLYTIPQYGHRHHPPLFSLPHLASKRSLCWASYSLAWIHAAPSLQHLCVQNHFTHSGLSDLRACLPRPILSHLSQLVALCLLLALRVAAHCFFFAFPSCVRLLEPGSLFLLWTNLPIYFLCLHILVTFFLLTIKRIYKI